MDDHASVFNLRALKRKDSSIAQILATGSHVTVYDFINNAWVSPVPRLWLVLSSTQRPTTRNAWPPRWDGLLLDWLCMHVYHPSPSAPVLRYDVTAVSSSLFERRTCFSGASAMLPLLAGCQHCWPYDPPLRCGRTAVAAEWLVRKVLRQHNKTGSER